MGASENAETIGAGYQAFAAGDMDSVARVFAPDLRWHIPGRTPISGDYTGHEEVFGFFGRLMAETGGTFAIEIHDLLASDDHVVVLVHETASRAGKTLEADEAHVWHVRDGMASEFWGIPADADAVNAFWD